MSTQIKVSILVPCYNVEKFLRTCLDSIVQQTLREIEILCINDGSTDDTLSILSRYAQSDARVKVINKKNSGYGDSMNIALNMATGEYIGIVESDDFCEKTMFEVLYRNAKIYDLDISRCNYFFLVNGEDLPANLMNKSVKKNVVIKPLNDFAIFFQPPSIWAAIYKTKWLRSNSIKFLTTPGAAFQDISFSFKTYLMAEKFMMIEDCLLHYRQHSTNSIKSSGKIFSVSDEWQECVRYVHEHNKFRDTKQLILPLSYNHYRWNYNRLEAPQAKLFLSRWQLDWKQFISQGCQMKMASIETRLVFFLLFNCPVLLMPLFICRKIIVKLYKRMHGLYGV